MVELDHLSRALVAWHVCCNSQEDWFSISCCNCWLLTSCIQVSLRLNGPGVGLIGNPPSGKKLDWLSFIFKLLQVPVNLQVLAVRDLYLDVNSGNFFGSCVLRAPCCFQVKQRYPIRNGESWCVLLESVNSRQNPTVLRSYEPQRIPRRERYQLTLSWANFDLNRSKFEIFYNLKKWGNH